MSNLSDIVPNFNLTVGTKYQADNQTLKFDLYLMTREMRQIADSLRNVTLLPVQQQRHWVKQNQPILQEFMNNLTHEMMEILSETHLEQDALQDVITCVTAVRKLAHTLHNLLSGGSRLQS